MPPCNEILFICKKTFKCRSTQSCICEKTSLLFSHSGMSGVPALTAVVLHILGHKLRLCNGKSLSLSPFFSFKITWDHFMLFLGRCLRSESIWWISPWADLCLFHSWQWKIKQKGIGGLLSWDRSSVGKFTSNFRENPTFRSADLHCTRFWRTDDHLTVQ